jgi:hypothetical protein
MEILIKIQVLSTVPIAYIVFIVSQPVLVDDVTCKGK